LLLFHVNIISVVKNEDWPYWNYKHYEISLLPEIIAITETKLQTNPTFRVVVTYEQTNEHALVVWLFS